jgi:NAD(P)-dependent dehydrogenase (short-subunit alcohol dehydrogenase family)
MSVFRPSAHALITGGASGVGYAVAQLCLKHSMRVSIIDSNQSSLDMARKNLSGDVTCIKADVSSRSDWTSIRQQVGTDVDLLMLNAGIGGKGTWGDGDYFDKILATNLGGVVNGLNAYVPLFKERAGKEASAIVITGSKQGITNPPGNPAYNASKAAVKTLAEHLSYDLKDSSVEVHLLVPGWTFTGLVSFSFLLASFTTMLLTLLIYFSLETSPVPPKLNQMVRGRPTK